ncbi:MAG: alanine racemase [Firmicutes bacterium]|nr:alanine racemase [Bacillota bacterium]
MARGPGGAQLNPHNAYSSWIEVDLSALEHNLALIRRHSQVPVLPVLKGNAYGHGASVTAAFLASRGLPLLAVGDLTEALDIGQAPQTSILVLSPPLPEQLPLAVRHRLHITATSPELVQSLSSLAQGRNQKVTVHIKVDTGFGRLGAAPEELVPLVKEIKKCPYLKLGGIFTHFPAAGGDRIFTAQQLNLFLKLKEEVCALGDCDDVLWHAANSAAFLTLPSSHLDLVRIGTLLYGQSPVSVGAEWDFRTTWQFKTRIVQIRTLPKGHSVGYGRKYRTKKPARIGVIPVGYSHGLELEPLTTPLRQIKHALGQGLKGQHFVFHPMGPLPILGRVGMGLTTVDLSKTPDVYLGDSVTLSMRRVTASAHVPRIYYLAGKVKCILANHEVLSPTGRKISLLGLF